MQKKFLFLMVTILCTLTTVCLATAPKLCANSGSQAPSQSPNPQSAPTNVIQTDATTSSITLSWNSAKDAVQYNVYLVKDGIDVKANASPILSTTYRITGLNAQTNYSIKVSAISPSKIESSKTNATRAGNKTPATIPTKCNTFFIKNYLDDINTIYYCWTPSNACDGYQIQVFNKKTGAVVATNDEPLSTSFVTRFAKLKKGIFYKTKMRPYIIIKRIKRYGAWSGAFYTGVSKKVSIKKINAGKNRKLKISWKKVTGIYRYSIYISSNKETGYKKVKTLSSKKTSTIISKIGKTKLKKNKTYYISLKYETKVGKQIVKSPIISGPRQIL